MACWAGLLLFSMQGVDYVVFWRGRHALGHWWPAITSYGSDFPRGCYHFVFSISPAPSQGHASMAGWGRFLAPGGRADVACSCCRWPAYWTCVGLFSQIHLVLSVLPRPGVDVLSAERCL